MSYGLKLVCLSLAAFFIVHAASALLVGFFAPAAIRAAEKMRPRAAARFLLTARLAPAGIAMFVVAALCIPSYLWFEPEATAEVIGPLCLAAAILSAASWAIALARAVRAILRSRDADAATVAVIGLIRPRVVVRAEVRRLLSSEEMDAALRHERAHAASHDNLKRLMILAAPDALPFFPFFRGGGFAGIEKAWRRFAEWAADDEAVSGDADRSVALASALVAVARLGPSVSAPLMTSLVDGDLAARVDRLLDPAPKREPDRWTPALMTLSAMALGGVVVRPGSLFAVYDLLERLIR